MLAVLMLLSRSVLERVVLCSFSVLAISACSGTDARTDAAVEHDAQVTSDGGSSGSVSQSAYIKATNTEAGDAFGWATALSGDGNTLAIGAPGEDSNARGIGGDQANNNATDSGAVYVYRRSAGAWMLEGYLKASNADAGDRFGTSLSIENNGSTLIVGADGEDSNAVGVNGDETNNSASGSGAVYVFGRTTGIGWSQRAYVKASNSHASLSFGSHVALGMSGDEFVVGATGDASNATGINGNESDTSAPNSGAAYMFQLNTGRWSQEVYLKASNTQAGDMFGSSVAISGAGVEFTVLVGAVGEASNAVGFNGDQTNNAAPNSGAVYIFKRAVFWRQEAYLKATNTEAGDRFGENVAINIFGSSIAVQASAEDGGSFGVGGDQASNTGTDSGAVYTYTRVDPGIRMPEASWIADTYFKSPNAVSSFGCSLALAQGAQFLVVGSANDNSGAPQGGAVSMFEYATEAAAWTHFASLNASNANANDGFGTRVTMNTDASVFVFSAASEDSNAVGIGGNQSNNDASDSGAVYEFSAEWAFHI
ncbi:MAG: integrin [Sandaracinaceae bacterium]|jgi:hypothetical protein|nr:integrin [Sandaracinaceae bacterium]